MKKHPRSTTVCSMQPRRSAEAQAMARDRAGRDMEPPSSGSDATMVGFVEGSTHRPDYVGEADLYVPVAPHPVTGLTVSAWLLRVERGTASGTTMDASSGEMLQPQLLEAQQVLAK